MNKDNSKKIISIVLVLVFICVGVLLVFFITKLGREEKKGLKEDILKYLNETYKVEGVQGKGLMMEQIENNQVTGKIFEGYAVFSVKDAALFTENCKEYNIQR